MLKEIVKTACAFLIFWPVLCTAEVKIAVIAPKSGEYQVWGNELIQGARIAIDEINHNGGVLGKKLELMSIDDACSDNLAVSTAEMLSIGLENKPSLVVGPYCSNAFETISKIYSKSKIFQIVPTTLNYQDADKGHGGMIKMVGFKEQASRDFFKVYNKHFAGRKTALVFDGETGGGFSVVQDEFRKYGKSSMLKQYNFNDYMDTDTLARAIVSAGEDVVVVVGRSKKIAKLIRDVVQLNENTVFFTSKYAVSDSFFEYAGDYLDSVYFVALPSFEDNPGFAETLVKLRLRGVELEGLNVYGYAAVKMWFELVEKAQTMQYDALAAVIGKGGFQTSWGVSFFNNGNVKEPVHYEFYQYKNGEYIPAGL